MSLVAVLVAIDAGVAMRLAVMAVLALLAVGVAFTLQRRRPDPPTAPSYRAPNQLDRQDFVEPGHPILAAVFASTTCNTCPEVWRVVEPMASELVAVERIDVEDRSDLHKRYRIDGVPTTILANAEGVVVQAFFGPVPAGEIDVAITAMREHLDR